MKAKIENLRITVNGKVIELTLEEAKELQKVLNETLSPQFSFPQVIERVIERERHPWVPIWKTSDSSDYPLRRGEITCKSFTHLAGITS